MKNHRPLWAALIWAGTALLSGAIGQQVYKCGNSYSQSPCPGAVTVDSADTRTPAQKAQTDAAAVQSAKLADQLEKDRLALEKASANKPAAPAPKAKQKPGAGTHTSAAKPVAKPKKSPPEHFVAAAKPVKKEPPQAGTKSASKEKPTKAD